MIAKKIQEAPKQWGTILSAVSLCIGILIPSLWYAREQGVIATQLDITVQSLAAHVIKGEHPGAKDRLARVETKVDIILERLKNGDRYGSSRRRGQDVVR